MPSARSCPCFLMCLACFCPSVSMLRRFLESTTRLILVRTVGARCQPQRSWAGENDFIFFLEALFRPHSRALRRSALESLARFAVVVQFFLAATAVLPLALSMRLAVALNYRRNDDPRHLRSKHCRWITFTLGINDHTHESKGSGNLQTPFGFQWLLSIENYFVLEQTCSALSITNEESLSCILYFIESNSRFSNSLLKKKKKKNFWLYFFILSILRVTLSLHITHQQYNHPCSLTGAAARGRDRLFPCGVE